MTLRTSTSLLCPISTWGALSCIANLQLPKVSVSPAHAARLAIFYSAMENKSLNIFNSRLILASPETATDMDYTRIEGVVAHGALLCQIYKSACSSS